MLRYDISSRILRARKRQGKIDGCVKGAPIIGKVKGIGVGIEIGVSPYIVTFP